MGPYRLGPVPKRLRRRVDLIATVGFLAIGVTMMITMMVVFEGVRPSARAWLVLAVTAAVVATGIALVVRSVTPDDRRVLELSHRQVLGPLPRPDPSATSRLRVALRPGPIWRRRLAGQDDAHWLVADQAGLAVPGWLLATPPRSVDRSEALVIGWRQITRFRVRSDSDGADTYDIECERPPQRPICWRVRRHEITDEIALLDYARSVGGITIELETDIDPDIDPDIEPPA